MLARVVDFAASNVSLFPKTTAAPQILAALTSAVSTLADQAGLRVAAEAEIRTNRRARDTARETLITRITQAEQTGKALKSDTFRPPLKRTGQAWISTGRAFAQAAEPLKKEFAQHGLPQFTHVIDAAVESFEEAILARARGKALHSTAIREFDVAMKQAMDCLAGMDALVANTLSDNPAAMASWTVARTVVHIGSRKAVPKPPAPPTPVVVVPVPPAPAPAPTPPPSAEVVTPVAA
jgi:hypothetical protein